MKSKSVSNRSKPIFSYAGETYPLFHESFVKLDLKSRLTMEIGLFREIENSVSRQQIELFQFRKKWHTHGMKPFDISSRSKIDRPIYRRVPFISPWAYTSVVVFVGLYTGGGLIHGGLYKGVLKALEFSSEMV